MSGFFDHIRARLQLEYRLYSLAHDDAKLDRMFEDPRVHVTAPLQQYADSIRMRIIRRLDASYMLCREFLPSNHSVHTDVVVARGRIANKLHYRDPQRVLEDSFSKVTGIQLSELPY